MEVDQEWVSYIGKCESLIEANNLLLKTGKREKGANSGSSGMSGQGMTSGK